MSEAVSTKIVEILYFVIPLFLFFGAVTYWENSKKAQSHDKENVIKKPAK